MLWNSVARQSGANTFLLATLRVVSQAAGPVLQKQKVLRHVKVSEVVIEPFAALWRSPWCALVESQKKDEKAGK